MEGWTFTNKGQAKLFDIYYYVFSSFKKKSVKNSAALSGLIPQLKPAIWLSLIRNSH